MNEIPNLTKAFASLLGTVDDWELRCKLASGALRLELTYRKPGPAREIAAIAQNFSSGALLFQRGDPVLDWIAKTMNDLAKESIEQKRAGET